jgi:hypothetical protein
MNPTLSDPSLSELIHYLPVWSRSYRIRSRSLYTIFRWKNPLTTSHNQSILRMSLSLSLSFSSPQTGGGDWRKNPWRALGGNLEAPWRSARGISAGNHSPPVREPSTEGLPPFTREGRIVARIVARVEQVLRSAILLRGCKLRLGRGWL